MSSSARNSRPGQHSRHILTKTDDSGPQQLVETTGLDGQKIGEAVRSQHFGLTSHAPADSEGTMLMLGGGADRVHALGMEHPKYRPRNLDEGATRLYDMAANHVHIDGNILRVQHASKIVLKVGGCTLTIDSSGFHFAGGQIDHDGHLIDRNHKHVNSGGSGLSGIPQ